MKEINALLHAGLCKIQLLELVRRLWTRRTSILLTEFTARFLLVHVKATRDSTTARSTADC